MTFVFVFLRVTPSAARNQAFDVVLVDTAGRMQDNAPLMTALAKLIAVNMPDLVLFVGEALVGNEAVDQLVRPMWSPARMWRSQEDLNCSSTVQQRSEFPLHE